MVSEEKTAASRPLSFCAPGRSLTELPEGVKGREFSLLQKQYKQKTLYGFFVYIMPPEGLEPSPIAPKAITLSITPRGLYAPLKAGPRLSKFRIKIEENQFIR